MQGSHGEADVEDIGGRLIDIGNGEEGERQRKGERNMEAYTQLYVKQITKGNLLYNSGNSNLAL